MGAKVVWLPTQSAKNHLEKMKQNTSQCVEVVKDGMIVPELKTILELVRDYDAVLGTAHISPEESFTVVEAARTLGEEDRSHPSGMVGRGNDHGGSDPHGKGLRCDPGALLCQNMGGGTYKSNLPDNLEIIKEAGYKNVMD